MEFDERYRKISQRMWSDERFISLSKPEPCGRYLWIYLLTGPVTGIIPGLFRATHGGMADDLDWSYEAFDKAFQEVFEKGLLKEDRERKLIYLPNGLKHNPPASPNVVKAWAKEFFLLPECSLRMEALMDFRQYIYLNYSFTEKGEGYIETFEKAFGKALPKALPKISPKPSRNTSPKMSRKISPNQEQEQEQDSGIEILNNNNSSSEERKPSEKALPKASKPEYQEPAPVEAQEDSPFGPDDTSPTSWPTDDSDSTQAVQVDSDIPDDEPTPAQKLSIAQGYWQEKGITPECRKLSPNWEQHKAVEAIKGVSLYKVSEIKDAINNLRIIQDHPDSYNQFKWELENFLARGMARYLTSADPLTNFLKPGFKKVSSNIRICKYCGEPAESEYRMFTCVKCGYNQVEDIEIFRVRMFGTQEEKEKFFAKPEEISAMAAEMRKKLGG